MRRRRSGQENGIDDVDNAVVGSHIDGDDFGRRVIAGQENAHFVDIHTDKPRLAMRMLFALDDIFSVQAAQGNMVKQDVGEGLFGEGAANVAGVQTQLGKSGIGGSKNG